MNANRSDHKAKTTEVSDFWKSKGVAGISHTDNEVRYVWFGGAFGHTYLTAKRSPSGVIEILSHISDNQPEVKLYPKTTN
jgi:hypothetical protein